ncbi:hypothetical protein [Occallatibacter savannae]|nr:hypothetical protein [Occallatibacter savannae]
MKLLLPILVLVVFALSFWADHKWRQWMKTRQRSHPDQPHNDPTSRP